MLRFLCLVLLLGSIHGRTVQAQVQLDPMLLPENSAIIPVDEVPLIYLPATPVAHILLPPELDTDWAEAIRLERLESGQVRLSYSSLPTKVALIRLLAPDGQLVYSRRTHMADQSGSLTLAFALDDPAYRLEVALPGGRRWEQPIPVAP
ncbi:MAG: hypothetical protein AAFV07_04990 [Bacteroidota bacterium]